MAHADAISLAGIDWFIILVYVIGTFLLGIYFSKFVGSAGDYFIAGKALPFWAIGMSVVVTDIGAVDFVAVAGETYNTGLAVANFDWIGSMPAMVFAAFLFIPYYWRSGVYTIPEFLGRRYNTAVQMIHAAIWGIFLYTMLALMLWITADKFLHTVLGWDEYKVTIGGDTYYATVWGMALITGIYTFSGGLTAVVMTDVIQLVVMFVGGFALLFMSVWEVGGFAAMKEQILAKGPEYQQHFDMLLPHDTPTAFPWTGIVFGLGLVMSTAYMSGNQAIVQRNLGAKSEWDAKGGMLFAGFLKCFIPLLVAVPGLAAILILPGLSDGDQAVPLMIKKLLPPGLRGLMFAALFAALMSSVDSLLNAASTIWTTDLYGRTYRFVKGKPLSERQGLVVGRSFTVFFIITAALLAEWIGSNEGIYKFIQTALSMFQGPVLAILLVGILWKGANQWGGLAGLVLGVGFTFILNNTEGVFPSEDPFLFVAWWSFVFSVIVTLVVSLITPADPPGKSDGLTFTQVLEKDGRIRRIMGGREV